MQRRIAERVAQWGSGLPRGSRVARESTGNACRASPPPRGRALAEPPPPAPPQLRGSPRGRGDLLRQDPRGARATPPAPPSAPPLPAESLGRAGHGSGKLRLAISTPGSRGDDFQSLVCSEALPRVSTSSTWEPGKNAAPQVSPQTY